MDLQLAIMDANTGSGLMRHFTEALATLALGNFHDNKPPADKFIPVPDENFLTCESNWREYYLRWYDGNLKSF
jgi:hypothetical protein